MVPELVTGFKQLSSLDFEAYDNAENLLQDVATASEQEEGTLSVKWMQENVKGQPVTALSTGIHREAESFAM